MYTARFHAKLFVDRFLYQAETKNKWTLIEETFIGDCEDFSLTVLWILSNRSWLRLFFNVLIGRAMIWHAKLNGEGHAMLWFKGLGWIDNNTRAWKPKPPAQKNFPYLLPMLMIKLLVSKFR